MSEKIKLVIWDLDETFWKGTLSEEKVEPIQKNIDLVKCLVDRGIMCSIVSKNDFAKAMSVLKDWGIDEYFVFPQISWNAKGETVKRLLGYCGLREENTLFLDDNVSNLEEVRFYNKGIQVELPEFLERDILSTEQFRGKDDKEHTRLKQYKLLEKRHKAEESFSTNEDFLRSSHIKIYQGEDCNNYADRIYELIERTNQLNYTKKRLSREALEELLKNPLVKARYIMARDDFGDYGIVGFYALEQNKLVHFLFSCRTLGFGIENYIYKQLDFPQIEIVGDVTVPLDVKYAAKIDWITEESVSKNLKEVEEKKHRMLMIAGCDLEQASVYLESDFEIKKEFTTVRNGNEIRTSDTSQLVNALELEQEVLEEMCLKLPFFDSEITFKTELFTGNFDVILLSVVDDYIRGMWQHNSGDFYIGYGGYFDQDEFLKRHEKKDLEWLTENFEFVGREDKNVFEENLRKIISHVPSKTKLLIVNGIDLDVSEWIGADRYQRNLEMNQIVDNIVDEFENVYLVDMRKIVKSKSALIKQDNRHFDRSAYYNMAREIVRICNEELHFEDVETKSFLRLEIVRLWTRAKLKLKRIIKFKRKA